MCPEPSSRAGYLFRCRVLRFELCVQWDHRHATALPQTLKQGVRRAPGLCGCLVACGSSWWLRERGGHCVHLAVLASLRPLTILLQTHRSWIWLPAKDFCQAGRVCGCEASAGAALSARLVLWLPAKDSKGSSTPSATGVFPGWVCVWPAEALSRVNRSLGQSPARNGSFSCLSTQRRSGHTHRPCGMFV